MSDEEKVAIEFVNDLVAKCGSERRWGNYEPDLPRLPHHIDALHHALVLAGKKWCEARYVYLLMVLVDNTDLYVSFNGVGARATALSRARDEMVKTLAASRT